MTRIARALIGLGFGPTLLVGCANDATHPVYEFEAAYDGAIATPAAIRRDVQAYASRVCGRDGYEILDRQFAGDAGPRFVRVRFGCT